MNSNLQIIAFGTFGNPNGFKQTFFGKNLDRQFARNVKTFDLNTNAIKLFPKSKLYAVRKEIVNGTRCISCSLYSFAKEQNSDRSGTFVGVSLLFINQIAEEDLAFSALQQIHQHVVNKYVDNDIITVKHSDDLSVVSPTNLDQMNFSMRSIDDIDFFQSRNEHLVIYTELTLDRLQRVSKKSYQLLNIYDTIYYTDSEDIAKFVFEKQIYKLVQNDGIDQELNKLEQERKRKTEQLISEFVAEKNKILADKNKVLEEYRQVIDHNEKLHKENETSLSELKVELAKVDQYYNEFYSRIDDYANQLKSGRKSDDVKKIYKENLKIFLESVNQLKKPSYIKKIPKGSIKSTLPTESQYSHPSQAFIHEEPRRRHRPKDRLIALKIVGSVLFLIAVGYLLYFFIIRPSGDTYTSQPAEVVEQPTTNITTSIGNLTPEPSGELNENDYRIAAKKLKYDISVEEVVQLLFTNNPKDIKEHYEAQLEVYSRKLIELNKNCFKERDGKFYFVQDTLRHIPSYKKDK